jgi:hypothetical protein
MELSESIGVFDSLGIKFALVLPVSLTSNPMILNINWHGKNHIQLELVWRSNI